MIPGGSEKKRNERNETSSSFLPKDEAGSERENFSPFASRGVSVVRERCFCSGWYLMVWYGQIKVDSIDQTHFLLERKIPGRWKAVLATQGRVR